MPSMPRLPPAERITRLEQRLALERAARLAAEAECAELSSANRRLRALVLAGRPGLARLRVREHADFHSPARQRA
jgi:hypothetical protein